MSRLFCNGCITPCYALTLIGARHASLHVGAGMHVHRPPGLPGSGRSTGAGWQLLWGAKVDTDVTMSRSVASCRACTLDAARLQVPEVRQARSSNKALA